MPIVNLLDHLQILSANDAATPARHAGWRARRLTPPDADTAVWVQWDPAVVVVALLVDDDNASLASDLHDAGFRQVGLCPSGTIWARPVRPLASEGV